MRFAGLIHKTKFLLNENSPTLLTGVGVAGTVATAYLTGKASFQAAQIIEKEKQQELEDKSDNGNGSKDFTLSRKVKLVWRLYILPTGVGLTTVTSIIASNRASSKRIAALAIASGVSERALQEYKTKVLEKFGERQSTAVRDEIAQDRVRNNPDGQEVIIVASGKVLCYDMLTGRYFESTVEDIKRAENKINYELVHFMSASLSEFYDLIGLPATAYTDSVGWNSDNQCEVHFSTVMSTDNRPCLAIEFVNPPVSEYNRFEY